MRKRCICFVPEVCLWDIVPPVTPIMKVKHQPLLRAVPKGRIYLLEADSGFYFWPELYVVSQDNGVRESVPVDHNVLWCGGARQRLTRIQIFLNQFGIIVLGGACNVEASGALVS